MVSMEPLKVRKKHYTADVDNANSKGVLYNNKIPAITAAEADAPVDTL